MEIGCFFEFEISLWSTVFSTWVHFAFQFDYLVFVVVALVSMILLDFWLRHVRQSNRYLIRTWFLWGIIVLSALFAAYYNESRACRDWRKVLLSTAETYSIAVLRMGSESISKQSPTGDSHFLQIKKAFQDWQSKIPFVASIYLIKREGKLVYLLRPAFDADGDGSISGQEVETGLGTPFDRKDPSVQAAFSGVPCSSGIPVKDEWGTWFSTAVPLHTQEGKVDLVLGFDSYYSQTMLFRQEARRLVLAFFMILLFIFFYGAFTIAFLRTTLAKTSQVNEQLAFAQRRIKKILETKSGFLVNMSHEIRTPMNAILGFIDILTSENFHEANENERKKITRIIKKNCGQLLTQINDITDVVTDDPSQHELHLEPMKLFEALQGVCGTLKPLVELKQLGLVEEWIHPIPDVLLTDPIRFKQILFHLLGNATKYTHNGNITIRCSAEREAEDGKPSRFTWFHIDVIDTGIGMSQNKIAQILTREDPEGSTITSEAGKIGLRFVQRFLERLGGKLSIQSREGVGSTFRVSFPILHDSPQIESEKFQSRILVRETHTPFPFADVSAISTEQSPSPAEVEANGNLKAFLDHLIEIGKKQTAKASLFSPLELSQHDANSEKSDTLKGCRVLLVEDVPINQLLVSYQLREVGAEVDIAENGQVGIEKIRKAEEDRTYYDVVLMDMQMPILDGYETTRRLRTSGYLKPIIALTAQALLGDREKTIDAGCNDYLTKPVDREKLIENVNLYWTLSNNERPDMFA